MSVETVETGKFSSQVIIQSYTLHIMSFTLCHSHYVIHIMSQRVNESLKGNDTRRKTPKLTRSIHTTHIRPLSHFDSAHSLEHNHAHLRSKNKNHLNRPAHEQASFAHIAKHMICISISNMCIRVITMKHAQISYKQAHASTHKLSQTSCLSPSCKRLKDAKCHFQAQNLRNQNQKTKLRKSVNKTFGRTQTQN